MINPYAIGKKIYLRAPELEDAMNSSWYAWFSDPEVTMYLGDSRYWPNTKESQIQFYESTKNSTDRLVLLICDKNSDELIGVCNLSEINWVHRHAFVALVIAEEKYRKGPAAMETLSLMLEIAFNRLNLKNVRAAHISTNPYTPVLCKLFGFKEVGRFEKLLYFYGEYVDSVQQQLSRSDWRDRNQAN